ncbi:MAG: glycosyltransferase family 4 protein [Kiritimatiellae bacterium]|nr:glycosyltransferase family 4 protein [Kiritimatiellia bacterium]
MSGSYSLSKTMRDFVIRLRDAGIPHQVFDCGKPDPDLAKETYAHLLTPRGEFRLLRYTHVVEMVNSPLPGGLPVRRCRIVFWEGDGGLLDVYPYVADSDVVIAMSDFNAQCFRKALPESVAVAKVVYPMMPIPGGGRPRDEVRRSLGLLEKDFVFLFNFDLVAYSRKNPDGLLRAFAMAFPDATDARLVLKTNHAREYAGRLAGLRGLADELGMGGRVVFVNDYMPSSELYALAAACDAYVSLHRGEGFGLGIAEAMQLGKPVVTTAYSAPLEFCNEETALLVPFTMRQLNDGSMVSRMGPCADADVAAAADAMRRLYDDRAFAAALGSRARRFMERHFSGEAFKASVDALLDL